MSKRGYRIRVSGSPRRHLDPVLLVQVVILLGRHLQQQQQPTRGRSGAGAGESSAGSPAHRPHQQAADDDG